MAQTAKLGGTAKDVVISKVGTGLMLVQMNWSMVSSTTDEQAFAAIKASMDNLPHGAKMLLNSGQFYSADRGPGNLELVSRFFEKYPEYVDKAFLSVKGGNKPNTMEWDPSPEGLRTSVKICVDALRGKKKIDLFQIARITRSHPLEEQMKTLSEMVKEGLFDHVGLSECSAKTIREANAVVPIVAVEIEVSPWSYEEETRNVIDTCAELGIAVVAYSPLGHGFLTGTMDKVPEGSFLKHFSRFTDENFKQNQAFVDALKAIAAKKGTTAADLCIAWVSSLGPHIVPLPGSSKPERVRSNINAGSIVLSKEELDAINKAMKEHPVSGGRYAHGMSDEAQHLWG